MGFAEIATEVAIGAEGLHQALGGTKEECLPDLGEGKATEVGVELKQFLALRAA